MGRLVERTDFGERLRAARESAGLTQAQLAERAGLYLHVVSKLERGAREPTWPTALKLAGALGVSVSAFEGKLVGNASGEALRPRGRPPKQSPAAPPSKRKGQGKGK